MRTLSATALRTLLAGYLAISQGCGAENLADSAGDSDDPSFGDGADYMREDGGVGLDGGGSGGPDGVGRSVSVRLVHALANVDPLVVCHDPDLVLDALDTPADETTNGPRGAVLLPVSAGYGEDAPFVDIPAFASGALTFHRRVEPVAGSDAGAGDWADAGVPPAGDGDDDSAPLDAGSSADASAPLEDIWPAPVDPCDPRTLEALMPLPFAASWLHPSAPPDLAQYGVVSTFEAGGKITLLASGFALDSQELLDRESTAAVRYLDAHPGDPAGAAEAGHAARVTLEAAYGPRVVPARSRATPGAFSLAFAHLVPDVPSSDGPSGALRLCIKIDDVEHPALPADPAGFPFRMRSEIDAAFTAKSTLTFRAFVASLLASEGKDCASTSLAPLAELPVKASQLVPEASYTLVVMGAVAPDALCNASVGGSLPRAGCTTSASTLRPHMMLIQD